MDILQMSALASILILLAAVLRLPLFHRVPKKVFVLLWCVVLVRLTVPFYIPIPGEAPFLENTRAYIATAAIYLHAAPADSQDATLAQVALPYIRMIWLLGVFMMAARFFVSHIQSRREYAASLPTDCAFVRSWLLERGFCRVRVRQSDRITSPLVYGIFRHTILLPKSLDLSDNAKLEHILAHETTHIRQHHLLMKLILAIALCLHWFNPIVWLMYAVANRDIEHSCDEAVVETLGRDARGSYARTLVCLEDDRRHMLAASVGAAQRPLEKRIVAIMRSKKQSGFAVVAAALLVIAMVGLAGAISIRTLVSRAGDNLQTLQDLSYNVEYEASSQEFCSTASIIGYAGYSDYTHALPYVRLDPVAAFTQAAYTSSNVMEAGHRGMGQNQVRVRNRGYGRCCRN